MEDGVSLRDFIISLLRRWRIVLLCGAVFGVLGAAFRVIPDLRDLSDPRTVAKRTVNYGIARRNYEQARAGLENDIAVITTETERASAYNEESLLMRIDPFHKEVWKIDLYVDTGYQIQPALAYQTPDKTGALLAAYISLSQDNTVYDSIIRDLPLDTIPLYLKEMIRVERPDSQAGLLTIEAAAQDSGAAQFMAEAMFRYLEGRSGALQSIGAHQFRKISSSGYGMVDTALYELQKTNRDKIQLLSEALNEKRNALDQLEEPVNDVPSKRLALRHAVQYGFLGGVGGAGIAVLAAYLRLLLDTRLGSGSQIREQFGLDLLGAFPAPEMGDGKHE